MGDSFAEGNSTDQFVLPAMGEAEFDMIVTTNFVSSFGRLLSRVGGGKLENLDYEITGKVLVDKGMIRKIPFNHAGTVDVSRALGRRKARPESAGSSAQVRRRSVAGASEPVPSAELGQADTRSGTDRIERTHCVTCGPVHELH